MTSTSDLTSASSARAFVALLVTLLFAACAPSSQADTSSSAADTGKNESASSQAATATLLPASEPQSETNAETETETETETPLRTLSELTTELEWWAKHSVENEEQPRVVASVENVTHSEAGSSGVVVTTATDGSNSVRSPFWAPRRGNVVVSTISETSVPAGFGPALSEQPNWDLPEEGTIIFGPGTVAFFDSDGSVLGHVSEETLAGGNGSLLDWLAANDRELMKWPTKSGVYPCYQVELEAEINSEIVNQVELCHRDSGVYAKIFAGTTELITQQHWDAFYAESGWDLESISIGVSGHYRGVAYDSASGAWLLDWSGECESQDALLFHNDRLQHVSGQTWNDAASATPVAWVGGAMVYTTYTVNVHACGSAVTESTVYMRTPDGTPKAIWSTTEGDAFALAFGS